MSKIYEKYKCLKQQNSNMLYLFESGIFYIFIDEDAKIVADILSLKITNLNETIVKCGFPKKSIEKYLKILNYCNYEIKIINSEDTIFTPTEFRNNYKSAELIKILSDVDIDNLSVSEAFSLIESLKQIAMSI